MRKAFAGIIRGTVAPAAAFGRDRGGSMIVEFALLAIPFFLLLFGVLETGIVFFGNSMLEKATADAARLVRTGQVQAQNMTQVQFHDYICNEIAPLLACSGLQVDVESFNSFDNMTIPNPINSNGTLNTGLDNYSVGRAGDIVLVRTFYSWNIVTPLIAPLLSNLSNGQRLLTATQAFRNEPF